MEKLLLHTSLEKLLRHNSYSFGAAAFFEKLRFQKSHFLAVAIFRGAKPLPSSHLIRIGSSSGQLLFGTATFCGEELLRIKILQKSSFVEAVTSAQHQLYQKSYIFEKANFSEKKYSALPTFSGELPF